MTDNQNNQEQESQSKAQEPTPAEMEMQKQMQNMNEKLDHNSQQAQQLQALLADPEVQRVVALKQAGKPVQVAEQVAEKEPNEFDALLESLDSDDTDSYDSSSSSIGSKELMALRNGILADTKELLAQKDADHAKELEVMQSQISNTQANLANERMQAEISACLERYPDATEYVEDMIKLSETHNSLSPEQLYKMAKIEKVGFNAPTVESERPEHHIRAPGRSNPSAQKFSSGELGFREMVQQAAARR